RPPRPERRRTGAHAESVLLQLMIYHGDWRTRAGRELSVDRFEVPTFREIYTALVALPSASPASDALAVVSPPAAAAWQRLAEQAAALEGQDLDAVYAAGVTRLDERDALRALPPPIEIGPRSMSKQQLSPTAKARFVWEKQKANSPSRPPDARREG
ncbi:MAG: hypothetical protein ACYC2K_19165, partial [Gemmatimonadales bacterium]